MSNVQSGVGSLTDYAEHLDSIGSILAANYPGEVNDLFWITTPQVRTSLQKLVSSEDDQYLVPPPWIQSLKPLTTTALIQTGSSPDEHISMIGDFRECLLGVRPGGLILEVFRTGFATDNQGAEYDALAGCGLMIRLFHRVDVAVLRPDWISYMENIAV